MPQFHAFSLYDALGRVTAAPVWAKISSPNYDSAAMDGVAMKAADTFGATETSPVRLTLGDQASWVDTGDPMPPEFDAVIMVEVVHEVDDSTIEIRSPVPPYHHVRALGEDIVATELLLPSGHRLRPADLAACAAAGFEVAGVEFGVACFWRATAHRGVRTGYSTDGPGCPRVLHRPAAAARQARRPRSAGAGFVECICKSRREATLAAHVIIEKRVRAHELESTHVSRQWGRQMGNGEVVALTCKHQHSQLTPSSRDRLALVRVALLEGLPDTVLPADRIFIERAYRFAEEAHSSQKRASGEPFIQHSLAVAQILADLNLPTAAIAAGLLHDVVEDTPVTVDEVSERFGEEVARIVEACSDAETMPKPPWRERKEAYIEHLEEADQAVLCVSLADKRHNAHCIVNDARMIGTDFWKRFSAGPQEQIWYYSEVTRVLVARRPGPAAEELRRTVEQLCDLAERASTQKPPE